MMSERPGVPGEPEGGRTDSPSPAPCPVPAAASNAAFLARLQEPFLLGDTLQCLEGKLPHWSCGCLLGQGSQASSAGFPAPPTARPGPALCLLSLQRWRQEAQAGWLLRETHIFLQTCGPAPWAPGLHFWIWGVSLCSPLSCRGRRQTIVLPKRKECVGVGGCFQLNSI